MSHVSTPARTPASTAAPGRSKRWVLPIVVVLLWLFVGGPLGSFAGRLVHGADAFLVRRDIAGVPDGRSVIAGYPWFNDWGRDTMIALPGLCLATGRHAEAATILRSFARFERDGLIPNDFPDDPAQ